MLRCRSCVQLLRRERVNEVFLEQEIHERDQPAVVARAAEVFELRVVLLIVRAADRRRPHLGQAGADDPLRAAATGASACFAMIRNSFSVDAGASCRSSCESNQNT